MRLGAPAGWIARLCLSAIGWRVAGVRPVEARYVLIAAPHTSNWDFPLMLLCGMALGVWPAWVGKHTLFRAPFGGLMRLLGGIPVDRSASHNMVDQLAGEFGTRGRLALAMPPEGTRSLAPHWKSGFYYVATQARVPIAMGYLDYPRKEGGIGTPMLPSGDLQADMDRIRAFYAAKVGRHPELQGPIRLPAEDER